MISFGLWIRIVILGTEGIVLQIFIFIWYLWQNTANVYSPQRYFRQWKVCFQKYVRISRLCLSSVTVNEITFICLLTILRKCRSLSWWTVLKAHPPDAFVEYTRSWKPVTGKVCSGRQVILLQAAAERLSPLSGNISKIKGNINGTARLKRLLLVYPRPKETGFYAAFR